MTNPIYNTQIVLDGVLKLLKCREYKYHTSLDTMTADYDALFKHMNENKDMILVAGRKDPKESQDELIAFIIHGVPKFNAERRTIVERIFKERRVQQKNGLLEVLIITKVRVNDNKMADMMGINYLPDIRIRITFFTLGDMCLEILNHDLNSQYEIIPKDQETPILEALRVSRSEIQQVPESDLSVRFIGACPGDFLRITRQSITSGRAIVYARVTGIPYKRSDK